MALSIGFRILSLLPSCYSSYGASTFTPMGLSPTVHASLRWTHTYQDQSFRRQWILRVPAHTDEGSSGDIQQPVVNDNVLYHSLSALASAEVNFWFTCRKKRLVARADGCGERCRMTFLATWASAHLSARRLPPLLLRPCFVVLSSDFVEG